MACWTVSGSGRASIGDDVFLAAEHLEHRVGLLVVVAQPDGERLLGVVFPGDKLAAAGVALALGLRAVLHQVVVHAASRAEPAVEHPAPHLAVRQVELDDAVDVVALQEELGLPPVPREPVDDEAVVPVVLGQPLPHDVLDHLVGDELAGRHRAPHLGAELGVIPDVPPEDVAHADVHQVEVGGEHLALGALPAALHAHDHVFAHAAHPGMPRPAGGARGGYAARRRTSQTVAAPSSSASSRPIAPSMPWKIQNRPGGW